MKILYIHQYFSTPDGATGLRSFYAAQEFLKRGHHIDVLCTGYDSSNTGLTGPFEKGFRTGTVDGLHVIEAEVKLSNKLNLFQRALRFLKFSAFSCRVALSGKYDMIYATSTPLTVAIPGILSKALGRKAKFVFEVRDLWPELPKAMGVIKNKAVLWSLSFLEWFAYHFADRLVALSPGMADGIAKRGIPTNRIATIPNGCDLELADSLEAASSLPSCFQEGNFVAVYAGTFGMANGLDSLLPVAEELKRQGAGHVKLLLIGSGMKKPALQREIAQQKLQDILIVEEPLPKKQLLALLKQAHVGLQILANVPAFYFGTSPNKFFDYLSVSLPVLTNYPGWVAELVQSNRCGVAVPPDDAKAFAEALVKLAGDRPLQELMKKNSRSLARESFNRKALVKEIADWSLEAN